MNPMAMFVYHVLQDFSSTKSRNVFQSVLLKLSGIGERGHALMRCNQARMMYY